MKTIEEAAEYYAHNNFVMQETNNYKVLLQGFIAGAKWQSEIMYSEMDIVLILSKFRDMKMIAFSEWFEQFRKK